MRIKLTQLIRSLRPAHDTGVSILLPDLKSGAATPLIEQIARFYAEAIGDGVLRNGDRLPPIRAVAEHARVTRTTVQQAYRRLADSGLVVSTVGRGTIVSEVDHERSAVGPIGRFALDALRELREASPVVESSAEVVGDFADLKPDPSLFPIDDFRAAIECELRERGHELLAYGDPSGSLALREHLATCPDTNDPATDPSDVLITSGAQQGIDLVIRTLTSPGSAVAAALPTYHQLFGILKSTGLRLAPVRTSLDGIDLDDLRRVLARPDVRVLYVMPTFHNPTGRTIGERQRREIIDIATECEVPILEDEFECELRFRGDALPSLRALDPRGWTATVRSFSKGLFPGVRVGWVHAGRALVEPLSAVKRFSDLGTSPLVQAALQRFIHDGGMDRHLGMVRAALRERHAVAQQVLAESMPADCTWSNPDGGFVVWVDLPATIDGDRLVEAAAERGVRVTSGSVFDPIERAARGVRLSLSRATVAQVREGVRILGECAHALADHTDITKPPLFL